MCIFKKIRILRLHILYVVAHKKMDVCRVASNVLPGNTLLDAPSIGIPFLQVFCDSSTIGHTRRALARNQCGFFQLLGPFGLPFIFVLSLPELYSSSDRLVFVLSPILGKTKKIVDVLEVLLVIDAPVVVVGLVPGGSAENLREKVMTHPGQVPVTRMGFREQIGHRQVVKQPGHYVLCSPEGTDLLDHDVDKDLQESVDEGMLDGFEGVKCFSAAMVVSVNPPDASDLPVVHQIMNRHKAKVVQKYPKQRFDSQNPKGRS